MSLNDFVVGKFIGKGAFGSVCLVTRKADKKIYAMKSINIGKLNTEQREASLNEIRILASLNHPNIIGYKEAFYDENSRSLNIIKRRLQFEESTVWEWIIQLLKGLKYLHDNKIMHRDLKCANIFLMKNGLLKIGDLNVSKITKSNMARTQTGTPYYIAPEIWMARTQTGTPYYIAPEIWKDKPYDYKCDIWSLGCIIYEICTSRPPFRGTSLAELGRNILTGYYLPFSGFSNDIKNLISKMLIVDPIKRASINELLNSDIIKRRISSLGQNNIINIKDNSKKANLIKTIKDG